MLWLVGSNILKHNGVLPVVNYFYHSHSYIQIDQKNKYSHPSKNVSPTKFCSRDCVSDNRNSMVLNYHGEISQWCRRLSRNDEHWATKWWTLNYKMINIELQNDEHWATKWWTLSYKMMKRCFLEVFIKITSPEKVVNSLKAGNYIYIGNTSSIFSSNTQLIRYWPYYIYELLITTSTREILS